MKRLWVFMLLFVSVSLFGCSHKEPVVTSTEAAVTEASTEDKFAVDKDEWNFDSSESTAETEIETTEEAEEEKKIRLEIESNATESEPYVYADLDGVEQDIRTTAGYNGILNYINSRGGIEEVAATLSKEQLRADLAYLCIYATETEIDSVLETIYSGTAEQKSLLAEELLHSEVGWYQTDDGIWKNVYAGEEWDFE